jgi:CheY-like chemotaxis protein
MDQALERIVRRSVSAIAPSVYAVRHAEEMAAGHLSGAFNNLLHYAIRAALSSARADRAAFEEAFRRQELYDDYAASRALLPAVAQRELSAAGITDEQWWHATMVVTLLLRDSTPEGLEATPAGPTNEVLEHARILVVDDVDANVLLVQRMFERAGCREVLSTTDPEQAPRLFSHFRPDLVFVDMVMPVMDGPALIATLRRDAPDPHEDPIVVLTAEGRDDWRSRAFRAGATDYVVKPLVLPEVLALSRELLETRRLLLSVR